MAPSARTGHRHRARAYDEFPPEYSQYLLAFKTGGGQTVSLGPLPHNRAQNLRTDFYRYRHALSVAMQEKRGDLKSLAEISSVFMEISIELEVTPEGTLIQLRKHPILTVQIRQGGEILQPEGGWNITPPCPLSEEEERIDA
jgi:hypothetical protein